jgi:hypothetical protein
VKYNTFDVTALLQPGANALGTVLGNGRINENLASPNLLAPKGAPFSDLLLQQESKVKNQNLAAHQVGSEGFN